jgi:hypothetical protein
MRIRHGWRAVTGYGRIAASCAVGTRRSCQESSEGPPAQSALPVRPKHLNVSPPLRDVLPLLRIQHLDLRATSPRGSAGRPPRLWLLRPCLSRRRGCWGCSHRPVIGLLVHLVSLKVLHALLDHGHAQHDDEWGPCGPGAVRQGEQQPGASAPERVDLHPHIGVLCGPATPPDKQAAQGASLGGACPGSCCGGREPRGERSRSASGLGTF